MDIKTQKELLLKKPLKCDCENTLYELRGNQFKSKEEIVDDIIANDDGAVEEMLEREGSFFGMLQKPTLFQHFGE